MQSLQAIPCLFAFTSTFLHSYNHYKQFRVYLHLLTQSYIHIRLIVTLFLILNDDEHQPKHTSREDLASHSKPGSFLFKTTYVSDLPISSVITASQKPTTLRTSMAAVGRYTKQQVLTVKQN